jgi:hypothetical protein
MQIQTHSTKMEFARFPHEMPACPWSARFPDVVFRKYIGFFRLTSSLHAKASPKQKLNQWWERRQASAPGTVRRGGCPYEFTCNGKGKAAGETRRYEFRGNGKRKTEER